MPVFYALRQATEERKKKPLPVRFTLISAWNQTRERMEAEDRVVFIVAEVALAHTWPFVAASAAATGDVYVASLVCVCVCVCVWSRPLAWCFHGCFHWGFPLKFTSLPTLPPPNEPRQFILNRPVPRERAGGLFEPCGSSFFFVVFVGFFFFFFGWGGGSDTVMHSVLLPGAPRSSSKVRLCWEYKVTWTSSCLHTHSSLFQLATYKHKVQLVELHTGDLLLFLLS